MKKKNEEKLKALITQMMEICSEEKTKSLTVAITKDLVSVWNDEYIRKSKRVDFFSNDRGVTWSDMR